MVVPNAHRNALHKHRRTRLVLLGEGYCERKRGSRILPRGRQDARPQALKENPNFLKEKGTDREKGEENQKAEFVQNKEEKHSHKLRESEGNQPYDMGSEGEVRDRGSVQIGERGEGEGGTEIPSF